MKRFVLSVVAASFLIAGPASAVGLRVGEEVPDLMLREAGSQRPMPLSETVDRHDVTVVVFLSPRCAVSNGYNETLARLATEWSGKKVRFVGIASGVDQNERHVAGLASQADFPFPVAFDHEMKAANVFGAVAAPEVFVIDRDRKLLYRGRIDDSRGLPRLAETHELSDALAAITDYEAPAVRFTDVDGCGIRR